MKAAGVRLPSNVNPTYDRLDVDAVDAVVPLILRQLSEWGVLGKAAAEPVEVLAVDASAADPQPILSGLGLGDHEVAQRRAYRLMLGLAKRLQREFVRRLVDLVFELERGSNNEPLLVAVSLLEAVDRLDPRLVGYDLIERMSLSRDFSTRSSAAVVLWDKAVEFPVRCQLTWLAGLLGQPLKIGMFQHPLWPQQRF